jgi:low affinity Fe/Cu permease
MGRKKHTSLERLAIKATHWVGTTQSLIAHSAFFVIVFILTPIIGFTNVLLILTTVVSLEAIYLSIFIQMSINRHGEKLKDLHEDVEDLQEDMEDLQEEEIGVLTDQKK